MINTGEFQLLTNHVVVVIFSFIYCFVFISFIYKMYIYDEYDKKKFTFFDYIKLVLASVIISLIPFLNDLITLACVLLTAFLIIVSIISFLLDFRGTLNFIKNHWDDIK